ncbi:MAG: hypothetical protein IT495_12280 [Gammaproteobacteria bacterium]|nr:hypothetical protein [Gammaproteobacteria bacterium]
MSDFSVKMRAEPVPWFGLFLSWITMMLGIEQPRLKSTTIELVPGDLPTVAAVGRGEADLGITTPPVCATMAWRGVGPYTEAMPDLRAILSFPHDDRLVWAVPADWGVRTIEELGERKLRFVLAGEGSPVGFAVERILERCGMPIDAMQQRGWEILRADYLFQAIMMVASGKADVVVHEGRKTPPWVQLIKARPMTFLPIPEHVIAGMVADYGFRPAVLAAGMIDGAVPADLPTLDWSEWLLFTRADVDDDLVHRVTRIVVEYRHLFEMAFKGQPLEKSDLVYPMDPGILWRNVGVPLHPAAERYFRDNGHMSG